MPRGFWAIEPVEMKRQEQRWHRELEQQGAAAGIEATGSQRTGKWDEPVDETRHRLAEQWPT
jgi:hypothetical protein